MTNHAISRRNVLQAGGLGAATLILPTCATPRTPVRPAKKPNILFIMADDHTANALGCYPSRLAKLAQTPHLDQLAAQGARVTNCFCTNSICAPSRATILTGQYSHKNGVYSLHHALKPERENLAKILQRGGYQTALVGKWHLKAKPAGFDYWNILKGQGKYHDPFLQEKGTPKIQQHKGFCTDIITDLSLKWLGERDKGKPFCLMTHFKNCHEPWHYAKRHAHLYRDVEIPEPESLFEDKSHRSPGSREYGFTIETMAGRFQRKKHATGQLNTRKLKKPARRKAVYQKLAKDYLRCVAAIDENVGRLLKYLEAQGLAENTVVIYTSDQGYFLGEHNYIDKRWMFEESLRMPLLIRYPGEIKPGRVIDDILLNTDFAPTMLDYAGIATPSQMQGRSFRANLTGRTPGDWRRAMYYHYWQHCARPAHYGIRTKRYKLIFFHGVPLKGKAGYNNGPSKVGWELYDLEKDPRELQNQYNNPAYEKIKLALKQELARLKEEVGDLDQAHPALEKVCQENWDK